MSLWLLESNSEFEKNNETHVHTCSISAKFPEIIISTNIQYSLKKILRYTWFPRYWVRADVAPLHTSKQKSNDKITQVFERVMRCQLTDFHGSAWSKQLNPFKGDFLAWQRGSWSHELDLLSPSSKSKFLPIPLSPFPVTKMETKVCPSEVRSVGQVTLPDCQLLGASSLCLPSRSALTMWELFPTP